MTRKPIHTTLLCVFALAAALTAAGPALAQSSAPTYPAMAPLDQYLMPRDAEIALARSAAPDAISRDASVAVLTPRGYETVVQGNNGWVCWVGRSWLGMFDHPEFWNPKIRAADCSNPPAARSVLPYAYKRTQLVLAGLSKPEIIAALASAFAKNELPPLEPGTFSFMMSKRAYLTDSGAHNMPHLMFYASSNDVAAWGANLPNSPLMGVNCWSLSPDSYPQLKSFPPLSVFLIPAEKWSDGSPASPMSAPATRRRIHE